MWADPNTVWGKNPALEKFWGDLSTMKLIVVITKAGSRLVRSPSSKAMAALEADKDVIALLSSNASQDAYELLYPKAKDKSVAYVIKNYKKYFKPIMPGAKMLVPY
jgi:hypothetical protein